MLRQVKADLEEQLLRQDVPRHGRRRRRSPKRRREPEGRRTSVNAGRSPVIAEVLMRLNDSHTTFYPAGPQDTGRLRLVRVDDRRRAVRHVGVTKGSDAEKKGLAPGDRMLAWNRYEPTRDRTCGRCNYLYNGSCARSSCSALIVRKPDGTEKVLRHRVEGRTCSQRMDIEDLFEHDRASAARDRRPRTDGRRHLRLALQRVRRSRRSRPRDEEGADNRRASSSTCGATAAATSKRCETGVLACSIATSRSPSRRRARETSR